MNSIFSLFLHETTLNQKKLIVSVSIIFGLLSPGLIGLAIWFKEPTLLCINPLTRETFTCPQTQACSGEYEYEVDIINSAESVAKKLMLVCDRKYLKRMLISCYFFGGVCGCIANILVIIPATSRKLAFSILGIIHALANLGIVSFPDKIEAIAVFYAMISFTWIILHSYGFMIMNENFQGDMAKSVVMIMMLTWGLFGIVYSFVAYTINGNYQLLFLIIGSIALLDAIYLFLFTPEKEPRSLKKHKSIIGLLKQMWPFPQIRFNVITYVIAWASFCVTYNDVFLKLETVGGSLYFNMGIISVFEMSASFISGIISMKVDISKCIKGLMLCQVALGATFLLAPIEIKHLTMLESLTLLIMMVSTKFSADIINNLINLYSPQIFTDEFIGVYLIMSRLLSRVFLLSLPTVNHYFERFGLHPFFFLSVLWGFVWLLTTQTKEIQEEGIHDVLAEFKVNLATRVSVIHNAEHIHIDDNLGNVSVDDKNNLSEIRTSRIQLRKNKSQQSLENSFELKDIEKKDVLKQKKSGYSQESPIVKGGMITYSLNQLLLQKD